jgi:RND family efflux transporter MFP subunit
LAADQEVSRQDRLVAAGIGARKDLDDAKAKAAAAAAELDAALARSGLASSQLARREIRAPRSGVVLHIYRKVGETVDGTGASPIAEVADLSVLEVHAHATPVALARLADKMPATVTVLGRDKPVPATIVRVAPAVDPVTLLGLIRLELANTDGVKVGSSASAQITVATRPGIRVPSTALRRSMVGADEVVVCAGGKAQVRPVEVGTRDDRGIAVLKGLEAGERIVVDHALGLEDDQPLVEKK